MGAINRILFLFFCLIIYGVSYTCFDRNMQDRPIELQPAPPFKMLQVSSGYLRQITSAMLFVRTSVFIGGLKAGVDELDYEINLAHNFKTMTSLYPEFIDPYFFANSILAPISKYSAKEASAILRTGIEALPDNFTLRFLHAFNYFHNLEQPLSAAEAFNEAAKLENAPIVFSRLAAIFSAHGGNLTAGIIMLKTMAQAEENEAVRERYLEEIKYFKKTIVVQNGIDAYVKEHNKPPEHLECLVPEYLATLPVMEKKFVLVYEPPHLYLRRP